MVKLAARNLHDQLSQRSSSIIQSSSHRDLLDIVDSLRSHGISHYVDLPQIIVCGSQSAGKSSTLESLSGIAFPTSEGLCTRFATELVLRRGDTAALKVQIQPGPGRADDEIRRLGAFSETCEQKDFARVIEDAKVAMGLSGEGAKIFSTNVLRIESTSPTAPNLTLVDLPGLFGAADKNQTDDDAALVQDMVTNYMKQQRSIILAVVTADTPFANQPVTRFARAIDPTGQRTLGLITKPDKIEGNPESQRYYVEMAQNQNVKLSLGWHVLLNRSHKTRDDTDEERDAKEAAFFKDPSSVWSELDAAHLGVEALRSRLRRILWRQIQLGLPGVKADVQLGIKDASVKLQQLGPSRGTKKEKHMYLHQISTKLSTLVRAAIDGVYTGKFFESVPDNQADQLERRLRANIQLILANYSDKMRADGHALEIVEEGETASRDKESAIITREAYLQDVTTAMVECKGRELPGTFNPLVIGDLFGRQCKPWKGITQNLIEQIHTAALTTFDRIVEQHCDSHTHARLMHEHIQPSLHVLRQDLQAKVEELLRPHFDIHPITYNKELLEKVQAIQTNRHSRHFDQLSLASCGYTDVTGLSQDYITVGPTLRTLKAGTKPDVNTYTANLAADVADAYYQVAMAKFVDDVSVDAVETCMIQRLPAVLSPDVVWDFSDELIEALGSEDASTVQERHDLERKLEVLEKGLADLDSFTSRTSARIVGI